MSVAPTRSWRRRPGQAWARWVWGVLLLTTAGCGQGALSVAPPARDAQEPPFARVPYQPFARGGGGDRATGMARLRVAGGLSQPADFRRPAARACQRVVAAGRRILVARSTDGLARPGLDGMHDAKGQIFPPDQDGQYAWSAVFIDYVMRMAGAVDRFPYSPGHAAYINAAREHGMGDKPNVALDAYPPGNYAPQPGDLICEWRARQPVTYADLPTHAPFPAHCDIIVGVHAGSRSTRSAETSTIRSRSNRSRSRPTACSPIPTPSITGSSCCASFTTSSGQAARTGGTLPAVGIAGRSAGSVRRLVADHDRLGNLARQIRGAARRVRQEHRGGPAAPRSPRACRNTGSGSAFIASSGEIAGLSTEKARRPSRGCPRRSRGARRRSLRPGAPCSASASAALTFLILTASPCCSAASRSRLRGVDLVHRRADFFVGCDVGHGRAVDVVAERVYHVPSPC